MDAPSSPTFTLRDLFAAVLDPARAEALFREECARAADGVLRWLTDAQACEFLGGCHPKTWARKRLAFGVPYSDLDGRRLYLRADLEALLLAHTTRPGTTAVIAFPSQTLREQRAKAAA